jgi:hypothetical protein
MKAQWMKKIEKTEKDQKSTPKKEKEQVLSLGNKKKNWTTNETFRLLHVLCDPENLISVRFLGSTPRDHESIDVGLP